MGNLEFWKELFRRYPPEKVIERVGKMAMDEMADMMKAAKEYSELQEPEPAQEPKLEAGCKVKLKEPHPDAPVSDTIVAYWDGTTAYLGLPLMDKDDHHSYAWGEEFVTVTEAATPGVGDLVEDVGSRRLRGTIIDSIHEAIGFWRVATSDGLFESWCRNTFTIICKAKGGE